MQNARRLAPRLLSLVLVSFMLVARRFPLPYPFDIQLSQVLMICGSIAWPAALAPWLALLPRRLWRAAALITPLLGFWAVGQPIVGFIDMGPRPNLMALPWVALAIVLGLLAPRIAGEPRDRFGELKPALALLVAICLLIGLLIPSLTAATAAPGQPLLPGLAVEARYRFTRSPAGPDDRYPGLAAFAWHDAMIILAPEGMIWHRAAPSSTSAPVGDQACRGESGLRPMPFNLGDVTVHTQGDHLLIAERTVGRIRCFAWPDGELVWERDRLGTLDQFLWTADAGWFLSQPPFCGDPQPGQAKLIRVASVDGSMAATDVVAPSGIAWTINNQDALRGAFLRQSGDTVYVIGNPREPFLYIPAQRGSAARSFRLPVTVDLWAIENQLSFGFALNGTQALHVTRSDGMVGFGAVELTTGRSVWSLPYSSNGYSSATFTFLPDQAIVLSESGTDGTATLAAHSAIDGQRLWQAGVRNVSFVEPVGDLVLTVGSGGINAIGRDGSLRWSHRTDGVPLLLSSEPAEDRLVILEPNPRLDLRVGNVGAETILRLSDGAAISRPTRQIGMDNYIAASGYLVRSPGPLGSNFLSYRAALRLDGREVMVRDPLRRTIFVAAGATALVTACETDSGDILVYVLGRSGDSAR